MKLLHISDLHTGKRLYDKINRNQDLIYALEQVKNICKEEKVEILLIAGDIFDKRNPDFESQEIILEFLTEINSFGMHTLLIAGNHDSYDFMRIYKNLRKLANIHVFDRPKRDIGEAIFEYKDVRIACLPYPDERVLTGLEENKERNYAESVARYMKALAEKVEGAKYKILMAHLMLDKAQIAGSELYSSLLPKYAIRADSIPETFDYVALGHIHKHQRIEEAVPKVYYSGSLYQIDFSEKDPKKFVNLLSLENGIVKVRAIELTLKKKLVEIELKDGDHIEKILEPFAWDNVLVKVWFKVKMGDPLYNLKKERIEKILGDKLAKLEVEPLETKTSVNVNKENLDLIDLYVNFYREEYENEPSEDLKRLLQELLDRVVHEANKA